jgi:hypothetical protein
MIQKLLSGRYVLTVTGAMVFAWMSVTGKLDPKDILIMIFTLYFSRNDRNQGGTDEKK